MDLARARTLSPRDVADALGVSESSVKRWIDAGRIPCARTAGGHRRVTLPDALRFVRASGLPLRSPGMLGLETLEQAPAFDADPLRDAVLAGDAGRIRSLLVRAFVQGFGLAELCDGPVRESCAAVGMEWHRDFAAGVAAEHRSIVALREAVALLAALLPEPPPMAPVAVGGAPAGDPYHLASAMAGLVLREGGWHTEDLGPDVPLGVFVHAAGDRGARLGWLSCSTPVPDGFSSELRRTAAALRDRGAALAVGGRQAEGLGAVDGVYVGHRMADLAGFARSLVG